jgi:hypothetical protein
MRYMLLAVAGLAAISAPAFAANLVQNGSFEDATVTTQTGFDNANVGGGWIGGASLTFLDAPGAADNASVQLPVYGPFPTTSPDGGNFVEADGDPSYSDTIGQVLTGLTAGQHYEVTFYQAAGQQAGFTGPTTEQWLVGLGSQYQLSPLFSLPQAGVGSWEKVSLIFQAYSVEKPPCNRRGRLIQ